LTAPAFCAPALINVGPPPASGKVAPARLGGIQPSAAIIDRPATARRSCRDDWALRWRSAIHRSILTLAVALVAVTPAAVAADQPDKWPPYLEFHADLATGPGEGAGGELFVPLWQDRHALLFGDFRAGVDDRTGYAGGGGTGASVPADDGWTLRQPQRRR
jgi:hypothetical protein